MDDHDGLTISIADQDAGVVVSVAGEVDMITAPALRAALSDASEDSTGLWVEMSEVSFLDSSGLAVLLETAARLDRFVLREPSRAVVLVLEASGLAEALVVEP